LQKIQICSSVNLDEQFRKSKEALLCLVHVVQKDNLFNHMDGIFTHHFASVALQRSVVVKVTPT